MFFELIPNTRMNIINKPSAKALKYAKSYSRLMIKNPIIIPKPLRSPKMPIKSYLNLRNSIDIVNAFHSNKPASSTIGNKDRKRPVSIITQYNRPSFVEPESSLIQVSRTKTSSDNDELQYRFPLNRNKERDGLTLSFNQSCINNSSTLYSCHMTTNHKESYHKSVKKIFDPISVIGIIKSKSSKK